MFANRLALGWGFLILAFSPALGQSDTDSPWQLRPFHDASISSLDDVWKETNPCIDHRNFETVLPSIELVGVMESSPSETGDSASLASHLPRLLPSPIALSQSTAPNMLSPPDVIRDAETGLFRWFFGMLGVIGVFTLVGAYWFYYVRQALDTRHTTGRLRLSSSLVLPRRSGLFLVDVQDHSVLVAVDGGGIRQVIPLEQRVNRKKTGRHAAGDASPLAPPRSTSRDTTSPEEVAFQDVYQESMALGGDVRAVLHVAKSSTRPQTAAVHSRQAP